MDLGEGRVCRRCGQTVASEHYETFERMHYVCFHYEFEHLGDVDDVCGAGGCPARGTELRWTLRDWTDRDLAAFHLGRALGTFSVLDEDLRQEGDLWTDGPLGAALHESLVALVAVGFLERRGEPDEQFRWRVRGRRGGGRRGRRGPRGRRPRRGTGGAAPRR